MDPETQRDAIGSDSDGAMHDFETSSHERVQVMTDDTVYEAGPSFVENDRPTERLEEMPAWLQTFAATEGGPEESHDIDAASVPEASEDPSNDELLVEPDTTLPDWLRSEPASSAPQAHVESQNTFDDFQGPHDDSADPFISEDDLPDWLRAFSQESAQIPVSSRSPDVPASAIGSATASAGKVRVPPVENVWLSAYDRQTLGPGRTLFALLASNPGGAADPGVNGTQIENDSYNYVPHDAARVDAPVTAVDPASGTEAVAVGKPDEQPRNSMRMLLLALLVVLLLLMAAVILL